MSEKLVEIKDLEISFGEGSKKFVAVKNANFFINKGETFSLVGESGSGKTTIIKLINGLLQPSLGNIYIHGQLPSPASKKVVSYLPDTTYLNENMKIVDAFRYFQDFYADFNVQRAYQLHFFLVPF